MGMILCPQCGKIADWSAYHQQYKCNYCHWKGETATEPFTKLIENALGNIGSDLEQGEASTDGDQGWFVLTLADTRRYFVEYRRSHLNGPSSK